MLGMLIRWALSALALILTSKIVPGITVDNFTALLIAAIVLGLVRGASADAGQNQRAAQDTGVPGTELVVHKPPKVTDSHQ